MTQCPCQLMVLFSHSWLWEQLGEKVPHQLSSALLSAAKHHQPVGDAAIFPPCHPWEGWSFYLLFFMKLSSIFFCWQLDLLVPLSAWLSISLHTWRLCTKNQKRNQPESLTWIFVLFSSLSYISVGIFAVLYRVQSPMAKEFLLICGRYINIASSEFTYPIKPKKLTQEI